MSQNPLQSEDWKAIQQEIVKKVNATNASDPTEVATMLASLEEYLRIPYDSPDFYIGLRNTLGTVAMQQAALQPDNDLALANVQAIKPLLETIVAYLKQFHMEEDPRSLMDTDPILRVMNEEGEELTDISMIQSGTMFVLADKRRLVNMLMLVLAVIEEKTTPHTAEKTITISQWNPNIADWEDMAGDRSLLQTEVAGKSCLIYSDAIASVLQLTEAQRQLVAWKTEIGHMHPEVQDALRRLGETIDPTHRNS